MNTCKRCIHFESGVLDCQDPKDNIDVCALNCQPMFPDESCDEFEPNAYYEEEGHH